MNSLDHLFIVLNVYIYIFFFFKKKGYTRIVLAFAAFPYSFERPDLFFLFYFLSYFLDALDGYAARLLDQGTL